MSELWFVAEPASASLTQGKQARGRRYVGQPDYTLHQLSHEGASLQLIESLAKEMHGDHDPVGV
jgi:hypothetical protein